MHADVEDLNQLLRELGQLPGAVPFSRLYSFSDLAGERLVEFRLGWDTLPTDQRRRLLRALVDLAETSFEVSFNAIFRLCLDDPDPVVRSAAIEGLWEDEDASLIGPLLTMLRTDPSAQVRAAAAGELGRFVLAGELEQLGEPVQARITTELLTAAHAAEENMEVRRRAIESVSYACTPEARDALEMAYLDDDEMMRLSAVVGMGRSCDRRWRDIVLAELESTLAAMRYEAALACGGLALREAVPALSRLLDDSDSQVRSASIWSLGQIVGDEAKQALLAAYEDADADTQAAIEDALAEQALYEGDLEFLLYDFDEDDDDQWLDDPMWSIWSGTEDEP